MIVLKALLAVVFLYLLANVLYIFAFALAAKMGRLSKITKRNPKHSFLVLIPAYKGDEVIIETAKESLKQDYPKDLYSIQVIADKLQPETVSSLKQIGVAVHEVQFEKSTKSKSLNAALDLYQDADFDYAVILDIDNHMAPDFLSKINDATAQDELIVQGHRIAKNQDTDFALMDAISEEINNSIFRKGHRVFGLSSALIGSAIAMRLPEFKALMKEIKAVGGFDKEMEVRLLRDGQLIHYAEDALVYDEKVQDAAIFETQRKRWLSAQFVYLGRHFREACSHLILKGNLDFFDKVFQFMLLPRVMLLGITIIAGLLPSLWPEIPKADTWRAMPIITIFSLFLACPSRFYTTRTLKALRLIPRAFVLMFRTLFKLKGANKTFIHTPHKKS